MSAAEGESPSAKSRILSGFVKPGFEAVGEAFVENFERRQELGAACCIYHRGERVVDLWGGIRNQATGEAWQEDTMVIVYSTTKGLAALALALAHSRGLLDYDERVAAYWPEFAKRGKGEITVRQLLAHQAGLIAFAGMEDRSLIADPERLAPVLARQQPEWAPGTRQGYHAISLGYYESELLRRVDPLHRTLGRYFQDEIATPLGLDFYIRLPEQIADARLATVQPANMWVALFTMPFPLNFAAWSPHANVRRALAGSGLPHDPQRVYARNFEVPAGGGVGTARAIAHAYSVFATGGRELGLREETLAQLMAPARAPARGVRDAVLKVEVQFSLGFAKGAARHGFGSARAFGHPGFGGSLGYADPEAGIGYAYVCNRLGTYLVDPRDEALRGALRRALGG